MVSVETPVKGQAARRPGLVRTEEPRRTARASSARARLRALPGRAPSAEATAAKASFDALAGYFSGRSQLRRALGWSPPTIRAWEEVGPSRPRADHVQHIGHLLAVAQAAHEWVHDDVHRVGAWLLAPNDALDGLRPATIVRTLGDEGVSRLLDGMYQIAPRTTAHEHVDLSPAQMRDALDRLGFPQPRVAPPVDVDLSDFDD